MVRCASLFSQLIGLFNRQQFYRLVQVSRCAAVNYSRLKSRPASETMTQLNNSLHYREWPD